MKYILLLSLLFSISYSAPAFSAKRVFTQNDGKTFEGYVKGDEYLHYIQTLNGDILKFNHKLKSYTKAIIKNNRLTASTNIYTPNSNKQLAPSKNSTFKQQLKKLHKYNRKNNKLGN